MLSPSHEVGHLIRQIAALVFIFICTTIAWMILGGTISARTGSSNEQLQGRVASTWGTPQEQAPPTADYSVTEIRNVARLENGVSVIHAEKVETRIPVALSASRVQVGFHLDPRQKGLLWYSTYQVQFAGDYSFRNNTVEPQTFCFRFKFPAQKAVYDGLVAQVNGNRISLATDNQGANGQAARRAGRDR